MPSRPIWRLFSATGFSVFKFGFAMVVVLVTMLGLLVHFMQEREREIETIVMEARTAASDLDQTVRRFADHAEILRTALESELANPREPIVRWSLVDRIQPSRFFDGFAIDDVPPDREAETGNVTGLSSIDILDAQSAQELAAAISLHSLFRLVKRNIPNTPWVYYLSSRGFISVYPWSSSADRHYSSEFLTKEFYVRGMPQANPERRPYWTQPYNDLFGAGLMVTVGAPVYWNDTFAGVVCLDLTIDTLGDYVAKSSPYLGEAALTTWQGRRFVGGNAPDSEIVRQLPIGLATPVDGMITVVHRLDNAPWLMVSRVSEMAVVGRTLARMQTMLFVTGVGLLCVAFLFSQLRITRALARKKEELEQVMEELVRARDDAQAANRAKSSFLANIGHEIRTPLNAIIGFADLIPTMAEDAPSRPVIEEYAAYIKDAGDHLLRVLNDLLDLAKAEANRIELNEVHIELPQLVARCLRMVAPQAEKGRLKLSTYFAPNLPMLLADDVRLRQILINLLSNAIKFTRENGRVVVAVDRTAAGGLRIRVSDTGVGIAEKDIPKALEPFGQIDNELSRRHRGTGLGLALTRRLVELHGGELAIESTVGRGTTVSILMPADRSCAPEAAG